LKAYPGKLSTIFYEFNNPFPPEDELEFYLSYAKMDMKILEPMCGSGRFLVEFLKKGYDIDGFDISPAMLKKCEQKLNELNYNANLQCCDFLEYSSEEKYDLIIIPANSFSLITEETKILQCLNKLKELCKPDGKIIIEIDCKNKIHFTEKYDVRIKYRDGKIVLRTYIDKIVRPGNAIDYILRYKLYEDNICVYMIKEKMYKKYYVKNEFEKYINNAGLKIEDRYIDYRKTRYNQEKNGKIIFIINKK